MYLLGAIVKKGIELNQLLAPDPGSPRAQQENQLRELLSRAKETAFGKYYGFSQMLASDDVVKEFQDNVPIWDYASMHERWWKQQFIYPDITWPGMPRYFALSSGTTGKTSKRIPVTSDFVQSMRDVGTSLIRALPNYDLPEKVFESEVLLLSSSADLKEHDQGHLEGEISGINVSNFPDWYDLFYRPGKEIAQIDDWDKRLEHIVSQAPEWNIGAMAGIPSWVLLMLKAVMREHKLKSIHDIWPNLTLYASGGVSFDTYRKDFQNLCGKEIIVMDTYLASEGFFAYSSRPESMAMTLALRHGYFYEFIPFDERGVDDSGNLIDDPPCFTIDEVELDQEYILIICTCAGTWRYMIGDTIRFVNLDPHEILITGRTKFFLNVVGSQLSEEKLDTAILTVSKNNSITINEYSVAAMKDENGDYFHQWMIVCDSDFDESKIRDELDEKLKQANKNYKVARNKALKKVSLQRITKQVYHDFLAETKKKGGQIKVPKVISSSKMKEFLEYID